MPPARLLMTAVLTASARSPGAFRFAAGVDEAAAAHVAIGDLVARQVDRIVAGQILVDCRVLP